MKRLLSLLFLLLSSKSLANMPGRAFGENRSIAVITLDLADMKTSDQYSQEDVSNLMDYIRDRYLEMSHSKLRFNLDANGDGQNDAFGPIQLDDSGSICDWGGWIARSVAKLESSGVDMSRYRYQMFIFPAQANCNFTAEGDVDCATNGAVCVTLTRGVNYFAAIHEIGHNLGMEHSGKDFDDDGQLESQYGDSSCPMGYRYNAQMMNAPHMIQMGWITPQDSLIEVRQPGIYRIASLHFPATADLAQVIKLKRSENDDYYLSYRTPQGADLTIDPLHTTGVSIHSYAGGQNLTHWLGTMNDGEERSLRGVIVRQLGHDDNFVTVEVVFP